LCQVETDFGLLIELTRVWFLSLKLFLCLGSGRFRVAFALNRAFINILTSTGKVNTFSQIFFPNSSQLPLHKPFHYKKTSPLVAFFLPGKVSPRSANILSFSHDLLHQIMGALFLLTPLISSYVVDSRGFDIGNNILKGD
ncbi:hypothetical protein, partial [Synechocystis salina]|uniref:hypothetical protein n=1 Tax=Synechocystis salina TaxID=945780 RepID=UPI001D15A5DA